MTALLLELDPVIDAAFLRPFVRTLLYNVFDILNTEFTYMTILFFVDHPELYELIQFCFLYHTANVYYYH